MDTIELNHNRQSSLCILFDSACCTMRLLGDNHVTCATKTPINGKREFAPYQYLESLGLILVNEVPNDYSYVKAQLTQAGIDRLKDTYHDVSASTYLEKLTTTLHARGSSEMPNKRLNFTEVDIFKWDCRIPKNCELVMCDDQDPNFATVLSGVDAIKKMDYKTVKSKTFGLLKLY